MHVRGLTLRWSALAAAAVLLSSCSLLWAQGGKLDQEELVSPALARGYDSLRFFTPDSGFVFTETEILRTTDAGESWRLLHTVPEGKVIGQLFFVDATTAWIATQKRGRLPIVLSRTLDGFETLDVLDENGARFSRHDREERGYVSDVFFLDRDHGWAMGYPYHVAVTGDGGRTWTGYLVTTGRGEPEKRIVMLSWSEGLFQTYVGMSRTTDGGLSWREIPGAPRSFTDLQCVGPQFCAILNFDNSVSFSTDGGQTWQRQPVPVDKPTYLDGRDMVNNMQVRSPTRIHIFGRDTHIPPRGQEEVVNAAGQLVTPRYPKTSFLITYDGNTWTRRDYENIASIGVGQFVDDLNGWAVSSRNNIFRTTDGGETWTTVQDYFRQIAARTPSPTPFPTPGT
jgi:photosystem II stability/assembly factor-like uncharacterized protein